MTAPVGLPIIPRVRRLPTNRASVVAVLDIGSNKLCCFIAKLRPLSCVDAFPGRTHTVEIIGIGHQAAHGIKSGIIVDMKAAEQDIRSVVDVAERMAGIIVDQLIVNVSCGRIISRIFTTHVTVNGGQVEKSDISAVLSAGRFSAMSPHYTVLHAVPINFSLDGDVVRNPLGMMGTRLSAAVHIASAESMPLRNLALCINRCHLGVEGFVMTPYAFGLACLVPDEINLGVTVIDMGAENTSVSIFYKGRFVYCDVVPLGGAHVTADIARGLSTTLVEAERIKALYGGVFASETDECKLISVPLVGDDSVGNNNYVPRLALIGIIRPRLEEIFELVRNRLAVSTFARYAGKQLVLTGGACQLPDTVALAQHILSMRTRIGIPQGIDGLPEFARGPSFSTACGLIVYPQIAGLEAGYTPVGRRQWSSDNYFLKVGQWIKESF